jgi:tetratricopeptide (TPR) repeat protein
MNPMDKFFAEHVKRLEDDLLVGHKQLNLGQLLKSPDLPADKWTQSTFDDDWIQVDFNRPLRNETQPIVEDVRPLLPVEEEQWVMKKSGFEEHPILKEEDISVRSLEDEYFADEFEDEGDIDEINASSISSDSPIVSHTLIDLYCAQHYYDKAIELLEKILELNPYDHLTEQKLQKVKSLKLQNAEQAEEVSEEAGHDELISIIENQVKAKSPEEIKVGIAFAQFLELVKSKSLSLR